MQSRRSILAGVAATAMAGCRGDGDSGPYPPSAPAGDSDAGAARPAPPSDLAECPPGMDAAEPRRSLQIPGLDSISWSSLSPDGRTLLVRDHRELRFVPVNGGDPVTVPLAGPSFGIMDADGSLAWSPDSEGVWLLVGETTRAGWVAGPLACARRAPDGRLLPSPPLRDLPGRLDQVTWVGGDGLGLAHLDLRGGYNRPELPDANPGLAVIEADKGRVREALPLREAIIATWGEGRGSVHLRVLATTRTRDGRVRALLRCGLLGDEPESRVGGRALWTEGEPLRRLPDEPGDHLATFAFTPDGERLLASLHLSASGVIMEHRPSPPPTPATGPYAALHDLEGRPLWTLSGTAADMRGASPVAVSADGRRGLVILPGRCGASELWGLVDLRQGRIVRRFRHPSGNAVRSAGFHGGSVWMTSYQQLHLFD